ncbi:hypothetical protein M422DRAFT_262717 [Sphaerobolus stellatus SS14]|uniref:Unplaced genomic scaffold SPHSTscaffold_117, whole genome shotgun sequence n=1 Tax=Sphaerobolus stellatus (strain SS14) TaxID=990650 RepID=A0A0C9V0J5_SPHS4|nr:hypothetical protein M422DRAFT_262717 [Sphaerobolus stellatus SS14]
MKSLSLLAIVTFALSFTAAAPLEPRELSTNHATGDIIDQTERRLCGLSRQSLTA